jgi:HSP20 family protein
MFDLMPWKKRDTKEVARFRSEPDNLFDRFFDLDFPSTREFFKEGRWLPSVDISEGKKEITVKAEIPGVDAKDIDIALDGRRLTIKGEKKQEKEEKDENYHRVERSYGYFNRTVELPTEVNADKVDASYEKGILKIVLKKTKEAETKKIEVKAA